MGSEQKADNKFLKIYLPVILGILVLSGGAFFFLGFLRKRSQKETKETPKGTAVSIPNEILGSKFGFLTGFPGSEKDVKDLGARWGRPHPGPFLWDSIQKNSDYDFKNVDKVVKAHQEAGLGILATLWPFYDSDQEKRADYQECQVSETDEFLPKGDFKVASDYLPRYRCNPYDWEAYGKWVKTTVERYDGDGKEDMPGLKAPIKYWEVMNEPDLDAPPEVKEKEGERLDFYKEGPNEYATLLKKTSEYIKEADSEAKVLIAGAAGGSEQFLNFYKPVFADKEAVAAFDIANVHCISNDKETLSFNVEPYKNLLLSYGIRKPIWVTEAEAVMSENIDENIKSTKESVKKAFTLGAERIFFTRFNLSFVPKSNPGGEKGEKKKPMEDEGADKSKEAIKEIVGLKY